MWLEILIFVILGLWLAVSVYWVIKHRKTGGCSGDCGSCGCRDCHKNPHMKP